VARIEDEEKRVKAFLKLREFASLETTLELLKMCRDEIVHARKRLATDRSLLEGPEAPAWMWALIDGRKWSIDMVTRDFDTEIAIIEVGADAELAQPWLSLTHATSVVLHKTADIPR
jgi:hypothetical protein